jgi:hypothetical protein
MSAKISLLGYIPLFPISMPTVSPQKVLPHWEFKGTLGNSGHAGLEVAWNIFLARKETA